MKKVTEQTIIIKEQYGDICLSDQIFNDVSNKRRPEGEVHIFEETIDGKKKILYKSNLVVYTGREMLAQRLVNVDNPLVSSTNEDWLQWFGLGEGGVDPADPLNPTPPIMTDQDLYSPAMISTTTSANYANPITAGAVRAFDGFVYPLTGNYKKIFDQDPATEVTFEIDNLNDNKYLVIKITTTIDDIDANGKQLSEAGLFGAASSTGGYSGNFTMFARVTFPALIKTSDRRLIFVWYLYV